MQVVNSNYVTWNESLAMFVSIASPAVRVFDVSVNPPERKATFHLSKLALRAGATHCGNQSLQGVNGLDPWILYDQFSDRWILAHDLFYPAPPFAYTCVYISKTSGDPIGGHWDVYEIPEIGGLDARWSVWPTDKRFGQGSYLDSLGELLVAFNRAEMLAGTTARYQTVPLGNVGGCSGSIVPADAEGAQPPDPGTPAVLVRQLDTEVFPGCQRPTSDPGPGETDKLRIWTVEVDWDAPCPIPPAPPPEPPDGCADCQTTVTDSAHCEGGANSGNFCVDDGDCPPEGHPRRARDLHES